LLAVLGREVPDERVLVQVLVVVVAAMAPPRATVRSCVCPASTARLSAPRARAGHAHVQTEETDGVCHGERGYRRLVIAPPVELHSRRQGQGPPLLLLHGMGTSSTEFESVLPSLMRKYDVLSVDLPGQGRSRALPQRPDLAAVTDAVERELDGHGVRLPHVLGISLGGRVGLELARRRRAASVVALSPTGPLTPPERTYQAGMLAFSRLAFSAIAPFAGTMMRPAGMRTALLALLRARGWTTSPDETATLVNDFAGGEDFWRLLRYLVLPECQLDYSTVRCPVRIAQGTHDVLSLSQALWLATLVPNARYVVLPLAGHSGVADVPQRVIQLVDEAVAASG
jgi:pimeloyl-ACP methyl ester carboxylesterase